MRLILCTLVLLATLSCGAMATEIEEPHILVYGTATTEVVPDLMIWSVMIRTDGETLPDVADRHDRAVANAIDAIHELGIAAESIQTSRMRFGEEWEHKGNSREMIGYQAYTDVSFRSDGLDLYRTIWIGLAGLRGATVNNVSFDHSQRIELRDETRRKALLAARSKAEDLASTLGSEIGLPLLIEEDPPLNGTRFDFANTVQSLPGGGDQDGQGLAPGKIPIRMRVKAAFQLVTNE